MNTVFSGYAAPTSSTTYTPNQFFDVVLPNASRGCLRLVGYLIRKTLGWSDEHGNPRNPEAHVSYRELIDDAGISRGAIKDAIQEALDKRYVQCLRFGQPHRPNEEGFSALYSLKWDDTEKYLTRSDEFNGFFSGNGNLTHIPNEFFDYTIPNEPLAIVQVIGVIIRTSIGWQSKFGFRRMQTELSFTEIMRRTGINSRTTVSNAIKAAIDGHHIRRVEHGVFDTNAGAASKATVYALRWLDDDGGKGAKTVEKAETLQTPQATLFDLDFEDGSKSGPVPQFKNRTGKTTVQKVDRSSTVQKQDREDSSESEPDKRSKNGPATVQEVDCLESKKRTGIKTTNINNTSKQQQTEPAAVGGGKSLALLVGRLIAEGIDPVRASELIDNFPFERIERQLEALPFRKVKTSKTGFLIRAIELDIPVSSAPRPELSTAQVFVSHFYAGLGGNEGEPLLVSSITDEEAATSLLSRFHGQAKANPGDLGREFARYVQKNENSKFPIRTLALAVRNFGNEFIVYLPAQIAAKQKRLESERRAEHEKEFGMIHRDYLRSVARGLESKGGPEWETCEAWMEKKLARRKQMSEVMYRRSMETLNDADGRTDFIIEYLAEARPECLPSFWDWDATMNDKPFSTEGVSA